MEPMTEEQREAFCCWIEKSRLDDVGIHVMRDGRIAIKNTGETEDGYFWVDISGTKQEYIARAIYLAGVEAGKEEARAAMRSALGVTDQEEV